MSEMPETLRNLGYHLRVMADKASEQIDADRLSRAADEVERADLPPTLSAAMELPEVKALVDAATALLVQVDGLIPIKHPQQKLERNKLRHAITALAAIKEPKT